VRIVLHISIELSAGHSLRFLEQESLHHLLLVQQDFDMPMGQLSV
jgi:hypothetical protein